MSWLAMGGHGAYVWAAYGVTLVILGGLLIVSLISLRNARAELKDLEGKR